MADFTMIKFSEPSYIPNIDAEAFNFGTDPFAQEIDFHQIDLEFLAAELPTEPVPAFPTTEPARSIVDNDDDDEDDSVAEIPGPNPYHAPLPASAAVQHSDPRITCNNKTALDSRWSKDLLEMTTVDLNRYLRFHYLSAQDVIELKKARRRFKSRGYSKTMRENRREARARKADGEDARTDELLREVDTLEAETVTLRERVGKLTDQLAKTNSYVDLVLKAMRSKGMPIPPRPQP